MNKKEKWRVGADIIRLETEWLFILKTQNFGAQQALSK